MTDSQKRTVLITGASRGLGRALARALAHEGWNLIIDARGAQALEEAASELTALTRVEAIPGDVTDATHRRTLAEAAGRLGGLDALVNNAGVLGPSPQPGLLDYPLDALEEVYRANTLAPLAVIQAAKEQLKPGACILNITSDAAAEPYEGWGGYGSSKAALEQMSNVLAAENPALRVYRVDPGDMRTRMQGEAFPGEDISDRPLPEESVPGLIRLLTGDLPSGRYEARNLPASGDGTDDGREVRELRLVLTVEDFDRAATFYREGLELPIVEQWSSQEGRGLVLDAGRATLELLDETHAEHVDRIEAGRKTPGPVRLAFEVLDVGATAASLEGQGAVAEKETVQTPWGHLNRRLRTPDGLQLTLFQPAAQPSGTEVA